MRVGIETINLRRLRKMKLFRKVNDNMFSFFRKPKEEKEGTVVFVDYEHWFYSLKKYFRQKPDIVKWKRELEEQYALKDIFVFADFSYPEIHEDLAKIRCVTNDIIETHQQLKSTKKDMTDFIMLDYIYRYVVEHPKIKTYIIFTGDAHFQSVVRYLMELHKEVIVYGVKEALSSQLKTIATKAIEIPASAERLQGLYPIIVDNMAYVSNKMGIIPTFTATAKKLAEQNGIEEDVVKATLNEMLAKGLLYTRQQRVGFNQQVNVLAANWENLEKAGLWSFN